MTGADTGADTKTAAPRPKVLMICVNRRFRMDEPSCAGRGSEALAARLEAEITRRGINLRLERSVCMGHCRTGPTIRLAPGGSFHHGPDEDEVAALLDYCERACGAHAESESGPPVHLPGS